MLAGISLGLGHVGVCHGSRRHARALLEPAPVGVVVRFGDCTAEARGGWRSRRCERSRGRWRSRDGRGEGRASSSPGIITETGLYSSPLSTASPLPSFEFLRIQYSQLEFSDTWRGCARTRVTPTGQSRTHRERFGLRERAAAEGQGGSRAAEREAKDNKPSLVPSARFETLRGGGSE